VILNRLITYKNHFNLPIGHIIRFDLITIINIHFYRKQVMDLSLNRLMQNNLAPQQSNNSLKVRSKQLNHKLLGKRI
jgi:hypothetical protein